MSNDTAELIRICEALPDRERAELADFARFLLAKQEGQFAAGEWNQLISDAESPADDLDGEAVFAELRQLKNTNPKP